LVVVGSSSGTAAGVRVVGAPAQSAPRLAPAQLIGLSGALRRANATPQPAAPVIKKQPANAYVAPGSHAHFAAVVSGYPHPSAQWQISHNRGASWRRIHGVDGYTYTFVAATSQNGDEFRAVFKNKRGKKTTAPAKLSVVAGYAAPLVESQPTNLTVAAGTNATFTAAANGDPAPNVQWQLSANGGVSWSNVSGGTSPTLSFVASSILSGYEFRAQFTNGLGTVLSSVATLTVAGSAAGETPVVTEQPTGQDVPVNTPVTFTAAASGSPTPSVQWQVSTDSGQTWTAIPGATSTSYTFQATAPDDRNEYNAVFTNSAGMATTEPAILGVGYQLTSNWSGYAAAAPNNSPYSSVTASWTIPTFTCATGSQSDSSQWVGIDGYNDETVEQDGTFANCDGVHTTPNYGAWYELVGDQAEANGGQINFPGHTVSAGDAMTATVSFDDDTDVWTFTVHDSTNAGWTDSVEVTWSVPARSSAEWIVERPELCNESGSNCDFATLADFGTVMMSSTQANDGSGQQSADALGAIPLEMIRSASDSTLLAQPNALDGTGEIFTDTWYAGS
jgi:hypothetical protein